ncbi:uncharacterized protein LOC123261629 [Cotesia glomerata]|uniref:uncharacterized protein LOC123261629 n=1 Tax=Cotesia glomerata TaxID=32391 RepID=UPI001D00EC17|nr:uncharacterized protein LOC123261629 [Cotesia glomerata]
MKILLCCILAVISVSQAMVPLEPQHPRSSGYIDQNSAPNQKTSVPSDKSDQPVGEKFSNMLQDLTLYLKFLEGESNIDVLSALSVVNDLIEIHSSRILSSMGNNLDTESKNRKNRARLPKVEKDNNFIPGETELTDTVSNLLGSYIE